MKKRLRKKLHLGEFRQYGFRVRFQVGEAVDESRLDDFWDGFIQDALETNGLLGGGACGRVWDLIVYRPKDSATDVDRETIRTWLMNHGQVEAVEIGPLFDLWNNVSPAATARIGALDSFHAAPPHRKSSVCQGS